MINNIFFSIQSNGIMSVRKYNFKYDLNWTSNNSEITKQHLFAKATFKLSEIVKKLKIRTIGADNSKSYSFEVDLSTANNSFTEQRHRKFGRCYSYYPEHHFRELGIYYITIVL